MNNWRFRILNIILKRFFYLLYQPFAWSYDFVANIVSAGMWQAWVLAVQIYLPGPNILELGYGPGHLQQALLSRQVQKSRLSTPNMVPFVVGLDNSYQMGRLAHQRLDKAKLPYRLVQAQSQSIPFPNEFFDQVTATFPSEYIYADDTVLEIARILKTSGTAVILPQALITGRKNLQLFAAWLFRVTGQAYEVDKIWRLMIQRPFVQAGFETNIEEINLPGSKIQVIIATKMKF